MQKLSDKWNEIKGQDCTHTKNIRMALASFTQASGRLKAQQQMEGCCFLEEPHANRLKGQEQKERRPEQRTTTADAEVGSKPS